MICRMSVNHGGGVVFSAADLTLKPVPVDQPSTSQLVCVHAVAGQFAAIIAVVYRPGSAPVQQSYFDELGAVLEQLATYAAPSTSPATSTFASTVLCSASLAGQLFWTDAASHGCHCHTSTGRNTRRCDDDGGRGLSRPCRRCRRRLLRSPSAVLGGQRDSRHTAVCAGMIPCLASS